MLRGMHQDKNEGRRPPTPRGPGPLLMGVVAVLVLAATALQIAVDRREARRQAEATATDITRVVESHVEQTVGQARSLLELVADQVERDRGTQRLREPDRWGQLHAYCMAMLGCRSLAVVDATGRLAAFSDHPGEPRIDASDRAYFQVPRQTRRLFIGPAVVTRVAGNPILFPIALPVYDREDRFLGVVTAGIDTAYAANFYGLMGFGMAPTVTLFNASGDVIARNPDMKGQVGKNNAHGPLFREMLPRADTGVYESVSTLDGRRRIAAWRRLRHLDLVIYAGIEPEHAYGAWRHRTERTLLIVAVLLGLVLLAMSLLVRRGRRLVRIEARNVELRELASTDALTGILNRRAFDQRLSQAWARHESEGAPLSVLLVDVDHFKAYNDRYGHPQGDACLREVAQVLASCLHRESDVVTRYGGEEFAVVLRADAEGAAVVAERLREAVARLQRPHEASPTAPHVTVSIGHCSAGQADDVSMLLHRADEALYLAKRDGRDRVRGWTGDIAAP